GAAKGVESHGVFEHFVGTAEFENAPDGVLSPEFARNGREVDPRNTLLTDDVVAMPGNGRPDGERVGHLVHAGGEQVLSDGPSFDEHGIGRSVVEFDELAGVVDVGRYGVLFV